MGICNVLAVVPFLCAAAPEEPEQDQEPEEEVVGHVIEAQPAAEVNVGVLNAPSEGSVRALAEYEVLPPATAYRETLSPEELAMERGGEDPKDPGSFNEWVGQNFAGQQDVATPPTLAQRTEEPEIRTARPVVAEVVTPRPVTPQPVVTVAVAEPTVPDTITASPVLREPIVTEMAVAEPTLSQPIVPQSNVPQPSVQANEVDLATLYAPAQPVPEVVARPAPVTQRASMTLGPRAVPLSAIKAEEAAEITATEVVFTEPVPFVERGASIAAEGVAQRKRQQYRRAMRQFRREQRRAGQDS